MKSYEVFGDLSWLWCNSDLHSGWPIQSMAKYLIPPIEMGQYKILKKEGVPVAYCSWAFLSKEVEVNYLLNPACLEFSSWNSGDRLWFIDWVSPFSKAHTWELKGEMAKLFDLNLARALRVKKGKDTARVMEFKGMDRGWQEARSCFEEYKRDILSKIISVK